MTNHIHMVWLIIYNYQYRLDLMVSCLLRFIDIFNFNSLYLILEVYFVCFIVRTRTYQYIGSDCWHECWWSHCDGGSVSLSVYCAIKMNSRSAASSASSKCRGSSDQMAIEKQDTNITRNSAYEQIKQCQLTQDGDVVYEKIEDNCLYDEIQVNVAYGDNFQP